MKKTACLIPILLLLIILVTGSFIYNDYGASPDEHSQIEAGHITWRFICESFGVEAPQFADLPALPDYYNRYYGQAISFPTVLFEALRGFRMDISSVLRMRHLWNFLNFFTGLLCLAWMTYKRWNDWRITSAAILLLATLPRIFADSFYNDRDVMLISWLLISMAVYSRMIQKPNFWSSSLFGLCSAMTINIRYYGLLLVIPLALFALRVPRKDKVWVGWVLVTIILGWYIFTPLAWHDPAETFSNALVNFISGSQRSQETGNLAEVLFIGQKYAENKLPWSYLPVWIIISTPLVTLLLSLLGIADYLLCTKRPGQKVTDIRDSSLLIILLLSLGSVMLIRPVEYDGWRHFYYLYVTIIWFAIRGSAFIILNRNRIPAIAGSCLMLCSFLLTAFWMLQSHPYQMIYFNPLFRAKAAENFDRDYWRLSTRECLNYLAEKQPSGEISIGEYNASIDNALIALHPQLRERYFIQTYFSYHREPIEYLIFNYSNFISNNKIIPLYSPIMDVERDGMKLASVYQRNHEDELYAENITLQVLSNENKDLAQFVADGKFQTEWSSGKGQNTEDWLKIELDGNYELIGLTLLPGADEREYARSLHIEGSEDGENWTSIKSKANGLLDHSFDKTTMRWLRLSNSATAEENWSVKEIIFYGHKN